MASFKKTLLLSAVLMVGLSACSTNNVLNHASAIDHSQVNSTRTSSSDISRDRSSFRLPKSDHVSPKGDHSLTLTASGQDHFKRQNYGLAHESFLKAVETSSDNATAWLGLAASLDQLGKFKGADKAYEQLLELKGDNARVLNNVGYSFLLRGDYPKARQYLNRAQNIDPNLEEIQGNIHLLEKIVSS